MYECVSCSLRMRLPLPHNCPDLITELLLIETTDEGFHEEWDPTYHPLDSCFCLVCTCNSHWQLIRLGNSIPTVIVPMDI
jgi:hypothetical protein